MLIFRNKEISGIYIKKETISEIYAKLYKIYIAIKSGFGKGFWINSKPWINSNGWRNS